MSHKLPGRLILMGIFLSAIMAVVLSAASAAFARDWKDADFSNRPVFDYPLPFSPDNIIGSLTEYQIQKGDTLLDVGRWYGLSGKEISDANGRIDWWAPPPGRVILPTEHILPEGPRTGIVLNIPEMRIYYYYPSPVAARHHRGKVKAIAFSGGHARVVYTFPVGLGRYDWKTPVGAWTVIGKVKNPTWVVPQDIYEEHLERDGEAEHVIPGGAEDNPLGHYKLALSLPEYGIHGTDVEWGVGMNVSHGCIRLYPEDIERLFMKTPVGTPGRFVYQPIKFGWRGDALYVEVHDDLYSVYPGLWNHAQDEVRRLKLTEDVDLQKLQKAVEAKSGVPTYVMTGPEPGNPIESASAPPPSGPPTPPPVVTARSTTAGAPSGLPPTTIEPAAAPLSEKLPESMIVPAVRHDGESKDDWVPLPSGATNDNMVE
jgi:L,D-transpeptidase ErfK/SrfK